jgi:ABC-type amino acid transport substrate-binding protein
MARKYRRTIGSLSLSLLMACAPERTDSLTENEFPPNSGTGRVTDEVFVPNASCTAPGTWDPQIGMPSASALAQLAPEGKLRVGILTGNAAIGAFANGKFSGTSVDMVCRLAAKLGLQLDMTTNSSPAALVAGVQNGSVDIGFALGLDGSPVASAHAYIGIQQVYLVGINTTIQTIADVDQPGVTIAVQPGIRRTSISPPTFTSPRFCASPLRMKGSWQSRMARRRLPLQVLQR